MLTASTRRSLVFLLFIAFLATGIVQADLPHSSTGEAPACASSNLNAPAVICPAAAASSGGFDFFARVLDGLKSVQATASAKFQSAVNRWNAVGDFLSRAPAATPTTYDGASGE